MLADGQWCLHSAREASASHIPLPGAGSAQGAGRVRTRIADLNWTKRSQYHTEQCLAKEEGRLGIGVMAFFFLTNHYAHQALLSW